MMGAWAAEVLMVEWATAVERGLDAVKVHLVEIEVALQKSLEALETEQKTWLEAQQDVVTLWG